VPGQPTSGWPADNHAIAEDGECWTGTTSRAEGELSHGVLLAFLQLSHGASYETEGG
jgi:hypothetical protein